MSDLDTRLAEALNADTPAARDPMFRIAVMLRRECQAFRRQLLAGGGMTVAIAIVAALGAWAVGGLVGPGPERAALMALTALVLTAILAGWGLKRLGLLDGIAGPLRDRAASVLRPLLWR
jgi:hypothetical protein